ncbi:MAG: acetylxylan esterase, partial [Victivallales bacterium]|nr:acetylxylan esterase [Victivallales bacterium]
DIRGVQYAMTLPEWNGKKVRLVGGSQGGFQTIAVAALMNDVVTSATAGVPWYCELGGVTKGHVRGWRPDYARGVDYYDVVNFARYVKCPVDITAGLSDWVCPPYGVQVLFNNLPVKAKLTFFQGQDHARYFGYNASKVKKLVQEK